MTVQLRRPKNPSRRAFSALLMFAIVVIGTALYASKAPRANADEVSPPSGESVITQWNGLWVHIAGTFCAERIVADPFRNQLFDTAERNPVTGNVCGEAGRVLTSNCGADGRECVFYINTYLFTLRLIDASHFSIATNGTVTDIFRKFSD